MDRTLTEADSPCRESDHSPACNGHPEREAHAHWIDSEAELLACAHPADLCPGRNADGTHRRTLTALSNMPILRLPYAYAAAIRGANTSRALTQVEEHARLAPLHDYGYGATYEFERRLGIGTVAYWAHITADAKE